MNLQEFSEKIKQEIPASMKAGRTADTAAYRNILVALQNAAKIGSEQKPNPIQVLLALKNQRQQSIAAFEKGGREDLAAAERAELSIIERYLPKQMPIEQIEHAMKDILTDFIVKNPSKSPADLGMKSIMSAFKELYSGQDGKIVADVAKKLIK